MSHDPLAGCRVIGFDLETTGLQSRSHRIVQFAVLGSDVDGSAIHYESLVDPQRRIPADAARIHGIQDADVRGIANFGTHIDRLDELFTDAVVVGHNVRRFDWPFMADEYLRFGRTMPEPRAIIDTLEVARRLKLPKPHRLGGLCRQFHVSLENAHTAGADAAATLLLLWQIMEAHPRPFRRTLDDLQTWLSGSQASSGGALGRGYDDLEPFDSQGKLRVDGENLVFAFGRHRGDTLSTVSRVDPDYLRWVRSPSGPLTNADRSLLSDWLTTKTAD
jgi:DNA polymerase-3 subunit epsilon